MVNRSLFDRLADEEEKFFSGEFLSPVLRGIPVRVRIAEVTVTLKVLPETFEGWGIFKATDQKTAKWEREPNMAEKRQYLDLYPRVSLVVCRRGDRTTGIPSNQSDNRFLIQGQVPISLPLETQLFDTIDCRFDGSNFWYDRPSSFRNRRVASALRDMLTEEKKPDSFLLPGTSREEFLSYAIAFDHEIESKKDRKEERLKNALQRGGAVLRSYVERGNTYTVEFTVDGQRHHSVVDSETLRVSSAGICLNGGDQSFDLQSLVGVIREGDDRGLIYRVGINR